MNKESPKNNIIPVILPGSINASFELENIDNLRERFDEIINAETENKTSSKLIKETKNNEYLIEKKLKEEFNFEEVVDTEEDIIEFYEVPEQTITLEDNDLISDEDIALAALEHFNSQKLSVFKINKIGPCLYRINNFLIQILISHPTSNSILIPINDWIHKKKFPQILLFAQVNDESKSVFFPGVLTAKEVFEEYEIFNNPDEEEFFINKNKFKGGLNRLFSIISILKNSNSIKSNWKIKKIIYTIPLLKKLIKSFDFLVFLLKTGVSLQSALDLTLENQKDEDIKSIFNNALRCHEQGLNISIALKRYPNIFDEISISLIQSGLEHGDLVEKISMVSGRFKKKLFIDGLIDGIFDYKLIFLIFCIAGANMGFHSNILWAYDFWGFSEPIWQKVLGFLEIFFLDMFFWVWFPGLMLIIFFSSLKYEVTLLDVYNFILPKKLKNKIINFILKTPIGKELIIKDSIRNLLGNLSYLLAAGIPISDSLDIAERQEKTLFFKKVIIKIKDKITKGQSFYESLKSENIFPKLLVSLFKFGENIGQLSQVISALSDFYEAELITTLKKVKKILKQSISIILYFISIFLSLEILGSFTTWILYQLILLN